MSTDNPTTVKKKLSRGKRVALIVSGSLALLIAIVLVYGFVITRSGYWLLSMMRPDSEEQRLSYASASETTQVIADEGFVLLRNQDGLLPLRTSPENRTGLNLFGMRSVQLVYNSGGSSASNVDRAVRLEDALSGEQGNFAVNDDLLNLYYNYYKQGKVSISPTSAPGNSSASEFIDQPSNITVPEAPAQAYSDTSLYPDGRTILEHARDFSDLALIVLGRGGGEMYDFTPEELRPSPDEAALIDAVAQAFSDVILVINSANTMELGFIDDYPSIKAALWIGYPGESGILSLARILNGTVNPSGHLPDTWLRDNRSNPAANNYIQYDADGSRADDSFHYSNAPDGSGYFVQYSEGVYVGYRYFETRHDTDPSFDYAAQVMYPFGHGLSYTQFDHQILDLAVVDDEVSLRVAVRNTGSVQGKDVIQVYFDPPYSGAIEKSTVNLVAFKKTNPIAPGTTETYTLTFPVADLASYDDGAAGAWTLEAGDYVISLRADSHQVFDQETWHLDQPIVYADGQAGARPSDQATATNRFDAAGVGDYLTRQWDPASRAFNGPQSADFTAGAAVLEALAGFTPETDAELGLTAADLPAVGQTLSQPIMIQELAGLAADDPKWEQFVSQLTVDEMIDLVTDGAWHIGAVERLGVPRTLTPDGSTTIGSSVYSGAIMGLDGNGVTYPIPPVIAATWNENIANIMGASVGHEAQAIGFSGWYAPAMNTHRTPFNGRNFEYYSEDPILAGQTAASVVRGARDQGLITFIKHFAVNDRESNCRSYLFTWASEQSIREIYLRPFEAAVKAGGSLGAMSSFNFIGSTWAGGDSALLNDVLRDEWGFHGVVITDAKIYPFQNAVQALYNGGDLMLGVMAAWTGGGGGDSAQIREALDDPAHHIGMTRNLVRSSQSILYAVAQTWPVR
ncbi:MAG: glycoside hydrolase family 3 C-terminal domain-containing protein [Propionibacteriaceae bacterium]|jgi:beta-glucosidase|nr:glycoside hydrolase family 3 C-terminal domain-containing protein [Propionibacteriaceae bacterium]